VLSQGSFGFFQTLLLGEYWLMWMRSVPLRLEFEVKIAFLTLLLE
jgi:hypothetical protein